MSLSHPNLANWRPPEDYQPVSSQVEGVSVYAPAPKEKPHTDLPVTYACPNCGASTRFDVAAGGVACEHCGYTTAVHSERVGRRAAEFEFTLETLSLAQQGWGLARRELHCDHCGAVLAVPENAMTATCPFCASNKVNLRAAPAEQLRPGFLIAFNVQMDTIRRRAAEWLAKGWFHPSDLASAVVVDRFNGVYLPFWTFDSAITARWSAEVGYERTERYYDAGSKDWKTRVVIDWRHETGQVDLSIDDLLVSGTTHASRAILERLNPFQLNDLQTYTPDCLAGWQALTYDVTLPAAWEQGKAVIREQAREACYADIPTQHVRNFKMTADLADETWRYILLPVYLAAYQYQGKVYQLMANGQTGTIAGQKPVAWWKVWLAIAALLAPGVLLGLIGLPLLAVGGVGLVPLVIGAVALVAGGVFSYQIYRKAVESEAA